MRRPKVTVTVRLRNTGKVTIRNVELERAWARPVDKTEPLDQKSWMYAPYSYFVARVGGLAR